MPGVGFIRVKLLQVDKGDAVTTSEPFDPFVAVNVKETVNSPGQKPQYVQKKRTIYPEWNTCFDAHIYEGRVINMIVNEKPNRMLAEVTISARALADKCRDGNISSTWVRPRGHCNTAYRYSQ
uniref:Protein kinase C delta type n=1 Tax=Magallana gigas TaxID=29159 RepID=K1PHK0_MAGGI|eukprot:XP_011435407.1 PREDICTED: protein kinase C delta type [Crassostrea gigas]